MHYYKALITIPRDTVGKEIIHIAPKLIDIPLNVIVENWSTYYRCGCLFINDVREEFNIIMLGDEVTAAEYQNQWTSDDCNYKALRY